MRRVIQRLAGFAVVAALFYSWLFTLSFVNRVTLYLNRESYRPETFLVTGAEYHAGDEGGDSWWLNGMVAGQEERLVPRRRSMTHPHSAAELLVRFPKGTRLDVLYNPKATSMLVQDESLRVVLASPDFWPEEERLRIKLGVRVLLPVPLALAVYVTVRWINRRHARQQTLPGTA